MLYALISTVNISLYMRYQIIIDISHNRKLRLFMFSFDINTFCRFVKLHTQKTTQITIDMFSRVPLFRQPSLQSTNAMVNNLRHDIIELFADFWEVVI